ncbi:hypothetical protein D917_02275 [Trichinella nativa]|uniref:MD-2-related lipid-recognition domain-containing protein n=2 Tax=Trichinella nativa TaxID=6335 RepID=A0A1Y3EK32_9BILA|nr:hypothetical protein D917_02275 [Trichinella nativa]
MYSDLYRRSTSPVMFCKLNILLCLGATMCAFVASLQNDVENDIAIKPCKRNTTYQLDMEMALLTDENGMHIYPVDLSKNLVFHMLLKNNGDQIFRTVTDATLQMKLTYFGKEKWITIPTMGMLSNIRECYACPMPHGEIPIVQELPLNAYGPLLRKIGGGGTYAVTVSVKEDTPEKRELMCKRIEVKLK